MLSGGCCGLLEPPGHSKYGIPPLPGGRPDANPLSGLPWSFQALSCFALMWRAEWLAPRRRRCNGRDGRNSGEIRSPASPDVADEGSASQLGRPNNLSISSVALLSGSKQDFLICRCMGLSAFVPVLSPRECLLIREPNAGSFDPGAPPNQK